MKRLIISILVGIVSALILAQAYCYYLHPEINFYRNAINISSDYEKKLRNKGHSCYIIGGGSEIRSSISPEIMLKDYGVPAVNVATAAPFGIVTNLSIALNHLQPGDSLVFSLIATDSSAFPATASGTKLAFYLHGEKAFTLGGLPANLTSLSHLISSDAASMMISTVRYLSRGYAYVYSAQAPMHPDGWMEIHRGGMQGKKTGKILNPYHGLSQKCIATLLQTKQKCQQLGADFIILLPPSYIFPDYSIHYLLNALHITRLGKPVLKDERLGIIKDSALLSDTFSHLNAQGSIENSRIIARALKEKQYWNESELVNRLLLHGIRVAPAQQGNIMP